MTFNIHLSFCLGDKRMDYGSQNNKGVLVVASKNKGFNFSLFSQCTIIGSLFNPFIELLHHHRIYRSMLHKLLLIIW